MRGDKIHTPENKLHQIFLQDIDKLRELWSEYMTNPYSTEDLLDKMSYYADRWGEACADILIATELARKNKDNNYEP